VVLLADIGKGALGVWCGGSFRNEPGGANDCRRRRGVRAHVPGLAEV